MTDNDFVVRMGTMKIEDLERNARVTELETGYPALSVWSAPEVHHSDLAAHAQRTWESSYRKYRYSTIGRIAAGGYRVTNCDETGHCDLMLPAAPSMADWTAIIGLFSDDQLVPTEEEPS